MKTYFFSIKLIRTVIPVLFAVFSSVSLHSQNFITEWTFLTAAKKIRFYAQSEGGTVEYTWSANPSGNSGSGSFTKITAGYVYLSDLTIDSGDVVTLSMSPDNLRRFYIDNNSDRLKLTNVVQWGSTIWTSMEKAFFGCTNLQISATDVPNLSKVTNMIGMFALCTNLNSPNNINTWNTASVTNMNSMFFLDTSFNQDIGSWNTSAVTEMNYMFQHAAAFNQDIGNWNTAAVTSMHNMFASATSFNQNIGNWNTAAVTYMGSMFNEATSFNQDIGNWTLDTSVKMDEMLNNCGMDCANYSKTLIGWQANNPAVKNRCLEARGLIYNKFGETARNKLSNNHGWSILDEGKSTVTGTEIVTACDSFTWKDGITYTTSNDSATYTIFNTAGCDSIVTLNLTINKIDTTISVSGLILTANATNATYQWIDCNNANCPIPGETNQSFTVTDVGSYAVIVTQNNCVKTSPCNTIP